MALSAFEAWVTAAGGRERLNMILARELVLPLTVLDLFLLHGLVALALKHPLLPAGVRPPGERVLRDFEQLMEAAGLRDPPQGRRAEAPADDASSPPVE